MKFLKLPLLCFHRNVQYLLTLGKCSTQKQRKLKGTQTPLRPLCFHYPSFMPCEIIVSFLSLINSNEMSHSWTATAWNNWFYRLLLPEFFKFFVWTRVRTPSLVLLNKKSKSQLYTLLSPVGTLRARELRKYHLKTPLNFRGLKRPCLVILPCSNSIITFQGFVTHKQHLTDRKTIKIAEILYKDLFQTTFPCFLNPLITSWDEILQQRKDNHYLSCYAVRL